MSLLKVRMGLQDAVLLLVILRLSLVQLTIDLNLPELQYLADHLTPIECRKLVAAAHFKGQLDNIAVDQEALMVPNDLPCIQLLLHWNSEKGEGKGETHEVLERSLRMIHKPELAAWLGKTVFKEIGLDLQRSATEVFLNDSETSTGDAKFLAGPTLQPEIEYSDPEEWLPIDTILYVAAACLLGVIVLLFFRTLWRLICKRDRPKSKGKKSQRYDFLEQETSGSESEDKFDVRDYTRKTHRGSLVLKQ